MAQPVVIVILLAFVLLVLPSLLSTYYIDASTQVAIYAIVAMGLGLLVGRVGLVSLGQAAVLAIGAWVAARILFATSLPFPLVLLGSGLITMVLGTLVGLPALRLSGLYLALITLMLAGRSRSSWPRPISPTAATASSATTAARFTSRRFAARASPQARPRTSAIR